MNPKNVPKLFSYIQFIEFKMDGLTFSIFLSYIKQQSSSANKDYFPFGRNSDPRVRSHTGNDRDMVNFMVRYGT